ncbi:MAG: diguanylate cyclase [Roseburia sp.]|nr:diguanylate cyclase [Roseburia sp.]
MKIISKEVLFTSGLKEADYDSIKPRIYKDNKQKLMIFSSIAMAFFGLMIFVSFVSNVMANNRTIYIAGTIISSTILLLIRFSKKNDKFVVAGIYIFIALLFAVGLSMAVITTPGERTVTLIALMLLAPIVFNDRPIRMVSCIGITTVIFIIAALQTKTGAVLESDIVNVTVYSILSMVSSTYMTLVKCERHFIEQKVEYFSQTDLLTGLYNRNVFLELTERYSKRKLSNNFTVIYFDVNELKRINDNLGHEAGDELIKGAADCIKQTFGEVGACCRTGGDEFIVLVDVSKEQLAQLCQTFERTMESWRGNVVERLHISYGCAPVYEFPDTDFSGLKKAADVRLYKNKAMYYTTNGIDRRVQQGMF